MKFVASAEVHREVFATADAIRRAFLECTERSTRDVSDIDFTFAYIPIIMPISFRKKYRERFRYDKKTRTFYCSPHLCYDVFLSSRNEHNVTEYVNGILVSLKKIPEIENRARVVDGVKQTIQLISCCMKFDLEN